MKHLLSILSARQSDQCNDSGEFAAMLRRVTARHKAAAEAVNERRIILYPEKKPIGSAWVGSKDFSWGERDDSSRHRLEKRAQAKPNCAVLQHITKRVPEIMRELFAA